MRAQILVVGDERGSGSLLCAHLKRAGYECVWARTGREALAAIADRSFSIMLLDLDIPDIDGVGMLRRVGGVLPTIVMTTRTSEYERIAGLNAGADDYLVKPFSPAEVLARIGALLRRVGRPRGNRDPLRLGSLTISRRERTVHVDSFAVALSPKEFDLLADLVEHAGELCSREDLLRRVWGYVSPGQTRTVDVHVAQLRRKLPDPGLIQTVPKLGYRAIASDELAANVTKPHQAGS